MNDKLAYTKMTFDVKEFVACHYSSQVFGQQVSAIYKKAIASYYLRKQMITMSR